MPDQEISLQAQMAVVAGYAYAGQVGGAGEGRWRSRFQEGMIRAAAAMNGFPAQEAQAVIDAQVFAGEYGGYDLEESSTRLLVKVKSDTGRDKGKDADGFERIRTDRTDGAFGRSMKERLDNIPVGSRIVVWKVLERMKNSEDDAKVRVLKHFEVLQLNKDSASKGPPSSPPPGTGGEAQVRPASPPTTTVPLDEVWSPVLQRIRALEPGPLGDFVRACQAEKLFWKNPQPEHQDRIIRILVEKEKA
jgi:hypothetical protein